MPFSNIQFFRIIQNILQICLKPICPFKIELHYIWFERKKFHSVSFFPPLRIATPFNKLLHWYFPENYNLDRFKSRVNCCLSSLPLHPSIASYLHMFMVVKSCWKEPVLIRLPKLSSVEPGYYLDAGGGAFRNIR